ncbi:MAG: hypothetical protein Rubg2KO_35700 [Rubricoccaceae bacterium]
MVIELAIWAIGRVFAPNPMREWRIAALTPYLSFLSPQTPLMPTCPRCALAALALSVVAFTGCSSNNPGELDAYEGTYTFSELIFTSPGVNAANVVARLDGTRSELDVTRGGTALLKFEYRANDDECEATSEGSGVAVLTATAGRTSLSLSARSGEDRDVLRCLLLPNSFTLRPAEADPSGRTLTATLENTRVNLNDYDSERYSEALDNVPGSLTVTVVRP